MGSPLCILIVDDSQFFLELEKQFLRNTPATVLTADSGKSAIEVAREHRPSLVFMDIDMLEMTGVECCRQFKADPALKTIPVVLIGDKQDESMETEALAAGAEAFLEKPIDRRQFLNVGHSFLVSIDRRETRRDCRIPVEFTCRGRRHEGHCIDVSSGGMFLECSPTAEVGESLRLKFHLPDAVKTAVDIGGRIAWINSETKIIKEDYPLGYGVEFVDISEEAGIALRRYFGI